MNKTSVQRALRKQCSCFHDAEDNEFWKCFACDANDYIEALATRMNEIGCNHCDGTLKEMLK